MTPTYAPSASGVCRFCGCDNETPCRVAEATLGRCGWYDSGHTCCTAPRCMEKVSALRPQAINALGSDTCVCGQRKRRGKAFCWACYDLLPWGLQGTLYTHINHGFALAYGDALQYLRETCQRVARQMEGGR